MASGPDRTSVDAEMKQAQPLPPDSPCPSVASSSSASSSSSTSSSSLSPNTRLDLILGLQPAASAKRKAHTALEEAQPSASLPPQEEDRDEKADDQPLCRSQPATKRQRAEISDHSAEQLQPIERGANSEEDNAVAPASMRELFTPAPAARGGGAEVAQSSSIPDSPQIAAANPSPEIAVAITLTAAASVRPTSPVCDMPLSLESSASSSAAPASPSSCPPSPVASPRLSASQPTQTAALCSSLSRLTTLVARSHSNGHVTSGGAAKQTGGVIGIGEHAALIHVEAQPITAAASSIALSPNVEMSVEEAEEDPEQPMTALEPRQAASTAELVPAPTAAAMVQGETYLPPTRSLSHRRCSQERGDAEGVAGMDAEGGVDDVMPPVDTDPLQLHSSQPPTMV